MPFLSLLILFFTTILINQIKVQSIEPITPSLCTENCMNCDLNETCLKCKENYVLNNNDQCESCQISNCVNCEKIDSIECSQHSFRRTICFKHHDCNCPKGFFEVEKICLQCPQNCDICNEVECLDVRKKRILEQIICEEGYYEDNGQCYICSPSCKVCIDQKSCVKCFESYLDPIENECKCETNYFSSFSNENKPICLKCNSTNGSTQFITPEIIQIKFDIKQEIRFQSNIICSNIFESSTLLLLGIDAICQYSNKQIIINLGKEAKINVGDSISLSKTNLFYQDCELPIAEFFIGEIQSPQQQFIPKIQFLKQDDVVRICRNLEIKIAEITNDGQRGLILKQWQVVMMIPFDENNKKNMETLLNNQLDKEQFIIEPLNLNPNTKYELELKFQNFLKVNGTTIYKFQTDDYITIQIQEEKEIFYVYENIQITALIQVNDQCKDEIAKIPINYQIMEINGQSLNLQKSGSISIMDENYEQLNLLFQAYTLQPEEDYDIKYSLSIQIKDLTKTIDKIFTLKTSQSKLMAQIKGGNRQVGESDPLILEVEAFDKDYEINYFRYSWSCWNLNKNDICKNVFKEIIKFQNSNKQIIPAKNLEPYNTFLFKLTVANQYGKEGSTQAIIVVTEELIPSLNVTIPIELQASEINLNTWIPLSFQYTTSDPDTLFYAGALLYNLDVVATLSFSYVEFKFKMWNHFSNFNETFGNEIILRASIYNPRYMMPAQTTIKLIINYPPKNCSMKIEPSKGNEFDTEFTISVDGCSDKVSNFSYQFWFYQSNENLQIDLSEAKAINNILLRNAKMDENQLKTQLPSRYIQTFNYKRFF